VENNQVITGVEGGHLLTVLQLEQYVFCTTISYVGSLAFKVGELNQFSYAPNQDIPLE